MKVLEYLDSQGVRYETSQHRPTFTAQQMAAEEHVPGMEVAKPVVVRVDGKPYLCVLPACCKIDLEALKSDLHAGEITLANEEEMAGLFDDCLLGAEPPFGHLYGMETLVDSSLERQPKMVFQAGTHELAVHMATRDFNKLEKPRVLSFCYHMQ